MASTAAPSAPPSERHCPLQDVLDEALGRSPRQDRASSDERWGGVGGNRRLTAWLGLTILVVSLAQLVTLLNVSGWIDWHVAIGGALIPFALAKTATTGWRMIGYYRDRPAYRAAGPPPTALRLLGPLVVLSTLGLVGTGVILVALGPASSNEQLFAVAGCGVAAITVHQAVFFAWAAFTGVHVLTRLVPAWRHVAGAPGPVAGGSARLGVLVIVAALATLSATLLVAAVGGGWR